MSKWLHTLAQFCFAKRDKENDKNVFELHDLQTCFRNDSGEANLTTAAEQ